MKTHCPKCGQDYEFGESQVGQAFSCLECGHNFVIGSEPESLKGGRSKAGRTLKWLVSALFLLLILVGGFILARRKMSRSSSKPVAAVVVDKELESFTVAKKCIAESDSLGLARAISGFDVNYTDSSKQTLLMHCVRAKNKEMAQIIIAAGGDLKKEDENGENVLHYAVRNGDRSMLGFLVERMGSITNGSYRADTLLGIAAENGSLDILRFLTANSELPSETQGTEKAIFRALKNGHVECVKELLNKYDIEVTDKDGNTLLLAAISAGNLELVRAALAKSANMTATNNRGDSAFALAVKSNNAELLALFDINDVDLDQKNAEGVTLPMLCAQAGNWELLMKTLTAGNLKQRDSNGRNVLYYACRWNSSQIVDILINKGVGVDAGKFEYSPLYAALKSKNTHAVKALLDAQANFAAKDSLGNDALMVAAEAGNALNLERMIALGISVLEKNSAGLDAYSLAHAAGHKLLAEKLALLIDEKHYEIIHQQVEKLLVNQAFSYNEKLEQLDALKGRVGKTNKIAILIEKTRSQLTGAEQRRSFTAIAEAIESAQKDKSYESAISTLESAIAACPLASNLDQAKKYLQKLHLGLENARKHQAELREKKEKLKLMTQVEIKTEIASFIEHWLQDMRLAKDTSSYWAHPILSETFYNVKSWEIIGVADQYSPVYNCVSVMVESSTKVGIPIRKTWKVTLSRDDNDLKWKILSTESQ
jgi:ankyrin repeat protein